MVRLSNINKSNTNEFIIRFPHIVCTIFVNLFILQFTNLFYFQEYTYCFCFVLSRLCWSDDFLFFRYSHSLGKVRLVLNFHLLLNTKTLLLLKFDVVFQNLTFGDQKNNVSTCSCNFLHFWMLFICLFCLSFSFSFSFSWCCWLCWFRINNEMVGLFCCVFTSHSLCFLF